MGIKLKPSSSRICIRNLSLKILEKLSDPYTVPVSNWYNLLYTNFTRYRSEWKLNAAVISRVQPPSLLSNFKRVQNLLLCFVGNEIVSILNFILTDVLLLASSCSIVTYMKDILAISHRYSHSSNPQILISVISSTLTSTIRILYVFH